MSAVRKSKTAKWKIYFAAIGLIASVTLLFSIFTTYVTYPTDAHRKVAQELAKQDAKALSPNADYAKIIASKEYKELLATQENVYTTRMAIGSSILSTVISVAMVVALYRYLRRHEITENPIGVTVLLDAVAMALTMLPIIFIGEWITGIKTEALVMIGLLIAVPFAVGFNALITFIIAKITEWYYDRSESKLKQS